ncbi:homeobox-leucine zipper family protein [Actinidia rufa]|uniref:Homeobox-leucine zipper family protein n=1 Tax=Actinidia rufa TaxID=165716 RepID=A0A7J0DG68_9ERIC|nr:homeobox-leucine zipper family protein [Actinidia rufa]
MNAPNRVHFGPQQLIRECPILCNIEPKHIKVWVQNRRGFGFVTFKDELGGGGGSSGGRDRGGGGRDRGYRVVHATPGKEALPMETGGIRVRVLSVGAQY